jgi:alkanesulfonate monooxygenase SsuD/methylene tetrahydromethanopterin reductase-like flavin-dependent oxidoreductase (luciferase family)
VPLPLLSAVDVAEQVLTLAQLTGGRCVLGAGLGYRAAEFALFGVARAERAARFEANLAAIRQHWLGQDGAPAGAPVWIGASAPAGIIRAGRDADAWLAPPTAGLAELQDGLETFRTARRQAGRPPATLLPVRRDVLVLDGPGDGRDLMAERIARRYRTYADWGTFGGQPGLAAADGPRAVCAGTAGEVVSALALLQETVFQDALVIVRLAWPGMTETEVIDQIRLFGSHVIPAMRTGREAPLDDFRAPPPRRDDERQADVPARAD